MSENEIKREGQPEEALSAEEVLIAEERFAMQTAVSRWIASGKKKPENLRRICEILVASDNDRLPELIKMIRGGSGGDKG